MCPWLPGEPIFRGKSIARWVLTTARVARSRPPSDRTRLPQLCLFRRSVAPEINELAGCRAALAAADLSDSLAVLPAHLTAETAHPAISQWMSALRALPEHNVSAPGEVRAIGYDDLPFANQTVPPLSTVWQDLVTCAAHLVDLLFRRIAGEATDSVALEPQLVMRQSS